MEGNSPRGSSSGGGDRSRAHDGGRLAPTFGDVKNELQWSAGDEIRLWWGDVTRRRAMCRWLGAARSLMEIQRARATARVSIFADLNSS
jgi:hypothetical protein